MIVFMLIVLYSMLVFCVYMMVKNHNTHRVHALIINAIYDYLTTELHKGNYNAHLAVHYDDIEDYDTTLWRVWDWSYKRLLPPEKLCIIQPFIVKEAKYGK